MGDINIDLLSFDTSQHVNEFIDNINHHYFKLKYCNLLEYTKITKPLLTIFF